LQPGSSNKLGSKSLLSSETQHLRTQKEGERIFEDLLQVQNILEENYLKNLSLYLDNLSMINTSAGGDVSTNNQEAIFSDKKTIRKK